MQKIIPHLWFPKNVKEAAQFYISIFPESEITNITTLHDTPSGDTNVVSFKLWNYSFMAIDGGPLFTFNPSISFMVNFDPVQDAEAISRLNIIWEKLSEGGKVLMPLDKYPFSDRYGWVEDKFGLSWQLILTKPEGEKRPNIIPSLLFVENMAGKAEEATDFYISIFKNSRRGTLARYPNGAGPDKEGTIMFTDFMLENQWLAAMDSALEHGFAFNEAISLLVNCEGQEEIDYLWEKLSAVPEAEQCGWLKDKYGISWQISPKDLDEMMALGTREQIDRITQAFMPMKKLDLAKMREVYNTVDTE